MTKYEKKKLRKLIKEHADAEFWYGRLLSDQQARVQQFEVVKKAKAKLNKYIRNIEETVSWNQCFVPDEFE